MRSRVELFEGIRRDARLEGMGVRALAKKHHVHRRTVRQALASEVGPLNVVDGCFWHRCPEHGILPQVNSHYRGLERNIARDRRVDQALCAAGWTVLRVWEHVAPEEAAAGIIAALAAASGRESCNRGPVRHQAGDAERHELHGSRPVV